MGDFSWQFTDVFEEISNSNELKCVYELLWDCPIIKSSWHESVAIFMETIMTCVNYLLTATALGAIPVFIYQRLINPVPYHYLRKLLHPWMESAIITVLIAGVLLPLNLLIYKMSYLIHGFKHQVANGNWNTIFCRLNSIKKCWYLKPILVINDVKKFQVEHLSRLLGALETIKDHEHGNKPRFPIILKMSDNIWMKGMHLGTTNSAFCF